MVICGKSKEIMQKWFEDCKKLKVAAEQGFYYKQSLDQPEWDRLLKQTDLSWIESIKDMMRQYSEKTDGAFIEEKESMIVWNYKDSDQDLGKW